jgi:carbamoyl-phosphate synthase large subunit
MDKPLTVAVTGLNATDNPGPGVAVIRSLRAHPRFRGRIVGLAYDALDPGIYARGLVDDVFLIPYPSHGPDALATRLQFIHQRVGGLDAIIPTLDAELASFIGLESSLRQLGIGMFLPTRKQMDMRSKVKLAELGEQCGLPVPKTRVLSSLAELQRLEREIPFPIALKGIYYDASIVRDIGEATAAFYRIAAKWGFPVIAQEVVEGQELDVLAVGDGKGGLVGALPMKKTSLTDKGKGWAGITIQDGHLLELTKRFMQHTRWRGACEIEVMRGESGYHVLEINPRFPAWCYLSAGAGMNLPYAALQLSCGQKVEPLTDYRLGTMFVRISLDQIATLEDLAAITQNGERIAIAEEQAA